jgi:hypothetical protein
MSSRRIIYCIALVFALAFISPAQGIVHVGDEAPDFTKTELGGGEISLSDYSGMVVVLFLLGYG